MVSVNGSSITGRCSNVTNSSGTSNCTDPTSSVLFDGHIPTLTRLDTDIWASQLLTIAIEPISLSSNPEITFDFNATPNFSRLGRVEVVMFHCPQWGIGTETIQALNSNMINIGNMEADSITSCDYLVRTCIMVPSSSQTLSLRFDLPAISHWVHLAEIIFHTDTSSCPPNTIVTGATATTRQETTSSPDTTTTAAITMTTTTTPEPTTPETTPPETTTPETTTPETTTPETTTPETTTPETTTTAETTTPETTRPETTRPETITAETTTPETTTPETAAGSETTSETMQMLTSLTVIITIPVVLLLLLIVAVAALVLLVFWRYKHRHTAKEDAPHTSSQTHTYQHQPINLQEIGSMPEEHGPTSFHTQRHDEAATFDNAEYSVVATELPSYDSRQPSESEIPSDHLYDQVDGKIEKKKAHARQQDFEDEDHLYDEVDKKSNTTIPKSAMEKKNRGQQKFLPSKTAITENHNEDLGSAPEEDQLYAQVNKSGKKKDRTQDTAQPPASQQNWLYQDDGHDMLAVSEQGTPEDHSYDRVEWNMGKEKESVIPEHQFHNKLEEVAGAASKEHLQSEDSQYNIADMSSNSLAETPEEYFHLRHHEKSVPYLEENASFSASRTDQDDMYAQLEESNVREVPRQQTAPHTMTERSQDHFYAEPEGEQSMKFPRKHIASHGKSHHLYAEVEEKKVRANQTGPPPPQNDLYSQIEERKVQMKSASLLRKSRDDRFTQPEEREARMQPTPSDQPQDHLYAQPDKKKVRAKSSSLLSKSHDNLYAQPEERDVHTPLTSFASCDRLRKSHDHLYAELEEGKANKVSKESMPHTSIKSRKPWTHKYAELEESAQPSSLSSQTSRASLKFKKSQAHVYAQLEEGGMHAQPSQLPPEELLYAEPEERRATKTRLIAPHAQLKGKQHANLYSQVEERDIQTQLSSLPPEELLYAKPEEKKATKKCSTLPPLRGGKPQAHLYAQLEERGASNVRATPPTIPVSSTLQDSLYSQIEERKVQTKSASLLSYRKSRDDRFTQPEERETRMQPIPSDRPQDHLYAQPDRKKVRTKSSSLLSKSHDNLYAQPEERDVHTPLTSFASRDRLRKPHDHLYAELEEGKGNKASKESTCPGSIKSGKLQTHNYAELGASAQPSLPSPQTSCASLKSKKPQTHVYAQLEEGEMHVQPLPLPSKTCMPSQRREDVRYFHMLNPRVNHMLSCTRR